jgi:hypothetical protein
MSSTLNQRMNHEPTRGKDSTSPSRRLSRSIQDRTGGARRDRTDDLMLAKHALSQLSYGPNFWIRDAPSGAAAGRPCGPKVRRHHRNRRLRLLTMVGLGRLERPTSPLSGVRSNHLSYRPEASPPPAVSRPQPGQRLILREERETRAAKSRIRDPDLGPIVPSESRGQTRWTVAEDSSLERR